MENEELCDLSSGLTVTTKDNINCDKVAVIGDSIQEKLDDMDLFSCSIKRKDQIRTLACLQNAVKVDNETVHVNPDILFNRLTLLVKKEEERTKGSSNNYVTLSW